MARKLTTVPAPPPPDPAPDLRVAVEDALAGMTWLTPADDGLKALALNYAEQIEAAHARAADLELAWSQARGADKSLIKLLEKLEAASDMTKLLGWLGPQLQGVLRDLGGAPAARKSMQASQPVGGRLGAIRSAVGRTASAGEHDPEAVDPATN